MNVVACPSCSKQLQYNPQQAGKQVRCPACQTAMILSGTPNPIPQRMPTSPSSIVGPRPDHAQPTEKSNTKKQIILWSSVGGGVLLVAVVLLIIYSGPNGDTSKEANNKPNTQRLTQSASVIENSIGMKFKPLSGGRLPAPMRSKSSVAETEIRQVESFEIGVYEVTQEQYEKIMGTNPSIFKDPSHPVVGVNWKDATEFCRKLTNPQEEKTSGFVYRLPTSAEWEYACRAGTDTRFSFGDDPSQLGDYAWFNENSDKNTHAVGQKKPNPWGLYDMHGNVSEWCQDKLGTGRVDRGGTWKAHFRFCASSREGFQRPDYRADDHGFRVARVRAK